MYHKTFRAMTFQEKIQDAVKTFVNEAKQNIETTKTQVTETYGQVVVAAKEEIEIQKNSLGTYQERIQSKLKKNFDKDTLVADVKEEVEFFSNEFKTVLERNTDRFKNIFGSKIEEVKETAKKATKKASKKAAAVASEVTTEVAE